MVFKKDWCFWTLPLGLLAISIYLSTPVTPVARMPASDEFKLVYHIDSNLPGAKALAIYRAQESIIDAIHDQSLKAKEFQLAIDTAQIEIDMIQKQSQQFELPGSTAKKLIERSSDYEVIEQKLSDNLDDLVDYNYTLLEDGELRIAKVQSLELAIDNTEELIAQEKITSIILAAEAEPVSAYGKISLIKKGKKVFAFVTSESEIEAELLKKMIAIKGIPSANMAAVAHSTNWGKVVYKNYPHLARFQKIKKEHMYIYLQGQFNKWQKGFAYDDLQDALDQIIDGKKIALDSKVFYFMKEQRKQAAILRNGYYSYTKSGKAPKDFERFVKNFGKLNDALQAENVEESSLLASKFKYYLINESKIKKMKFEVQLISGSKLEKRMNNLAKEIAKALELEELSSHEFHKMRKQLKLFLQLTKDIRDYQASGTINDLVVNELDHIVTRLGDWHDTHIAHKLQGFPVLESFSINAVDRRLIRESMMNTTQLIMPGKCSDIFGQLFR